MTDHFGRLWRRFVITRVTIALILAGCATPRGVLDVSWVAPVTNTDDSSLTDLVAYRVYYSTTDPPCPAGRTVVAAAPKVTLPPDQRLVVRLTGLTLGELYYVAVTAVNSWGKESSCTGAVSARARQP
jgi:hypothetical protein